MALPTIKAPAQPALTIPIAPGPQASPLPTSAAPSAQRASTPSPKAEQEKAFPGPKLDRAGLQIHASGKISEIYGPAFARQDGFARQVRMPEPPLLLADRLLGIDAEPGSMGLGTLWTETDVRRDSWYLHEGRMPAGIMIEAGQADLMLISYLGIDWLNQGERFYRLLGCDLTYHGSLPAPGDTLRYDIHVDGHAQQGEVRLFFFHYDCRVGGQQRLTVRNGQAGFFTDQELDDSKGVLWDAATAEHREQARLDPPRVACGRTRFSREQIDAFADGRVVDCFGPGFELSHTHTRTPRISGGRMLFLDEVTELSTRGGPWGRGYLRATQKISPDSWFFQGHFKNDPCMPGTLMFEGSLQAMAFYLASLGYTLDKDAWRFEPVPEETYKLRCRGQATPQSKEVVYEVFVEEIVDGPVPTLWADLLCTVDGRKAFHCRRMGLRLVPGWPLDSKPELVESLVDSRPVASAKGFQFGSKSLLACAWGKPSDAFGPMYGIFDGTRRVPRLPGPPYQFMSRIAHVEGEIGAMQVGSGVEAEYDVPPDAWYFEANGARTMPFCVLLEAALQPCGWLASYVGSATTTPHDLSFRNLDGDGKLLAEILPDAGILRTRVTLTNISQSAGMIIESFDVACMVGERKVYELKTVFGFFPKEALEAQKGLPVPDGEREALEAPSDEAIELKERPRAWFGSGPHLAPTHLCMIDRLSGFWPKGGPAGLGRFRAEHDVRHESWFFKAHFFQDPVQPGSLGIEAMLQVLQLAMLKLGMADGPWAKGRFEPIAVGADQHWKYRGQVLPRNRKVTTLLDLIRVGEDERGRFAVGDASLWVDGLRIYEAKGLGMRIVRDGMGSGAHAPAPEAAEVAPARTAVGADEELLDPAAQAWLQDHRPTFTIPALPLMSMVDRLASAASRRAPAGKRVIAVEDARALRWVPVPAPLRLKSSAEAAGADHFEATLQAWRDASSQHLSRFEPICSGRVLLADEYPAAQEAPWEPPADARPAPDPYESGDLFHGPSFRLVRSLDVGSSGSSAILDAAAGGPARGLLHEALLDALTHGIPHDRLSTWSKEIEAGLVGYPHRVTLRLFGPLPASGLLRLETRFAGFADDRRFPRLEAQLISGTRLIAHLSLTEVLFPLGPVGKASPRDRRAFLRDHVFVEGVRLSTDDGATTRLSAEAVRASDWLPGTVASAFACDSQKLGELAAKEHVSRRARVHPASVHVEAAGARIDTEPLTLYPLELGGSAQEACARDAGEPRPELAPVRDYWSRYFHIGHWPVEDLYFGLAERFVRRVHIEDPAAFAAIRGRPILYLGNHQVGIESLMFSLLAAGLSGVPTVTLAKAEHRTSWLGLMIKHAFAYPGAHDPRVITYFQRDDPTQLPVKIAELAEDLKHGRSAMVHVEGTRALTARHPVIKMSGAFLDMTLAVGAPVVPVRFIGGLPIEPLAKRIELPIGMGQQEIWFGRPIMPEELAPFAYKERKEKVISAINALGGIPNSEEQPFPGDEAFDAEVRAWSERTGASYENAALLETLRALPEPHPEVVRLLEGARSGRLVLGDSPKDRWLAELAHRLFGDRGPQVVLGAR
jgi:3-hydroxymyristoyl/3-hydroxydecanoyl-(acyl carrier protein) dehydratase/1-acyl-sn-glycerol-3-phosphate acyltransferase